MTDIEKCLRAGLSDRYSVRHEIGRGGTARVYLAEDRKHGRLVAVKVLNPDVASGIGTDRFLREIELTAQFNHPHILPLFDSGDADGCLYYVMPHVEGPTLRHRLRMEKRLPIDEAVKMGCEVADALGYAHALGVVHRDIKPANVMFLGEHAVVADFGIAGALHAAGKQRLTATVISIGTPIYMSPEQAGGEKDLDGRSDLYSLGCVLYETIAGAPPFEGSTVQSVVAKHLTAIPEPLDNIRSGVPESVASIVACLLEKDPADRFQSAEELRGALSGAPAQPSSRRRRPGAGRKRRRTSRAKVVSAVTLGGVSIVAAAAVVVGLLGRPSASGPDPSSVRPILGEIAVLPFTDLSPAGDLTVLSLGFTKDLISALGDVDGISVRSLAATRHLADAPVSPDSMGRELGVGTLVQGFVEPVGQEMEVTVHLFETSSGRLIGDPVEVSAGMSQLESLRRGIVEGVAVELRRALGDQVRLGRWRSGPAGSDAWLTLLRAEEMSDMAAEARQAGALVAAFHAQHAADSLTDLARRQAPDWIDPVVYRGWLAIRSAGLVKAAGASADGAAISGHTERSWLELGLAAADEALAMDPRSSEAWSLRGAVNLEISRSETGLEASVLREGAERDLNEAIALDPEDTRAWMFLGQVLIEQGRFAEAADATARSLEADAFVTEGSEPTRARFFDLLRTGRLDEASLMCETGRQLFPDDLNLAECGLHVLGWSAAGSEAIDAAWDEKEMLDRRNPADPDQAWYRSMMVAAVLARSGLRDSSTVVVQRTVSTVADTAARRHRMFVEAYVQYLQSDTAAAIATLESHIGPGAPGDPFVANHYWFRGLRGHPEFEAVVAGQGRGEGL